jgi:hypothetical protein
MLTSHRLMLGSLIAVFCAIGIASPEAYAQSAYLQSAISQGSEQSMNPYMDQNTQQGLPPAADQPSQPSIVDVSYRGSGRLDDKPEGRSHSQNSAIAHRGSGRVLPLCL